MDKLAKLLEKANSRLKTSNSGIKIFKRGQKLSLRGMLPPKKGKDKASQQVVSLGTYCNAAGIQSAEKQAQKLASQLALREFDWQSGGKQSKTSDNFSYWVKEFEVDYFNRRERNKQSQTTSNTDYNHIFKRIDSKEKLTEETLIQLILTTEPDTRQRQRAVMAASSLAKFAEVEVDLGKYKGNYTYLKNSDRVLPTEEKIVKFYWSILNPRWQRAFGLMAAYGISNHELFHVDLSLVQDKKSIKELKVLQKRGFWKSNHMRSGIMHGHLIHKPL